MYFVICLTISAIGVLLFLFTGKIAGSNQTLTACFKALGAILVVLGLTSLYMLLSGKLTLPLW